MKRKQKKTPYQQLRELLQTPEQIYILAEFVAPLSHQCKDDLCCAITAYIRFGLRRKFCNRLLDLLFTTYCELLDN